PDEVAHGVHGGHGVVSPGISGVKGQGLCLMAAVCARRLIGGGILVNWGLSEGFLVCSGLDSILYLNMFPSRWGDYLFHAFVFAIQTRRVSEILAWGGAKRNPRNG